MNVLILGSKGMLGGEIARQLSSSEHFVTGWDFDELDITDSSAAEQKISSLKPDLIFNCIAYNAVDKAESDQSQAFALNSAAPESLAKIASKIGATLVHYSSGFVFDGESGNYSESDRPNPQSVYAKTKYQGEQAVSKNAEKYYIIRLNLLFGTSGQSSAAKRSFPEQMLDMAKTKNEFDLVEDEVSTPTYSPDLARASIQIVFERFPYGIYHIINEGQASWYDFGKSVFDLAGLHPEIRKVKAESLPRPARRPKNSVLLNTKFPKLRPWQQALKEFIQSQKI